MPKPSAVSSKPILQLNLHREWFDAIACGKKKKEFRACTPYWTTRLDGRTYTEIHFRNGYATKAPWLRVEFKGVTKQGSGRSAEYVIRLGKVLRFGNYRRSK
jgi:hypothetical protein